MATVTADPILRRDEWRDFGTLETLQRKAGVRRELLPRLVVKELADNGMDASDAAGVDASDACDFGLLDGGGVYVEDYGDGLPGLNAEVADLFSIRRPPASSKLWRRPTRGMLGNGLRVVAGFVLATGGDLLVRTSGRSLRLRPRDSDGGTDFELLGPWDGGGTVVEVRPGEGMEFGPDALRWAERALGLATGRRYRGLASPWWYDADAWFELAQAHGERTARQLVERLDGCSGRKAKDVAGPFARRECRDLSPAETEELLSRARAASATVPARRLGCVGREVFEGWRYAKVEGKFSVSPGRGIGAEVPCVIEAWALEAREPSIAVSINRTPVTCDMSVRREAGTRTNYAIFGGGLATLWRAGQGREVALAVNIIAPYMPLTTDGKAPDLKRVRESLIEALEKAARKVRRTAAGSGGTCQKDVILEELDAGIAKAGGGKRYSQRQLYYAVRGLMLARHAAEPSWDWFCKVVTAREAELGSDLPGIYRDARGTLYHPHTGEEIALGTIAVEAYERPAWTFNKVLYCEKEGFFPILRDAGWPERHDCALLTSKGFASRAARDVIDLLGETEEEILFFAIHDADGPGTGIVQALQEATLARPARKVQIINLGLEPEEALGMGLQVEGLTGKKRDTVPVASYVPEEWRQWLQTQRVELNAMTTPQFLAWLDAKLEPYARKLIPPQDVLEERLYDETRERIKQRHVERVLREARIDDLVDRDMEALGEELSAQGQRLQRTVGAALKRTCTDLWAAPVKRIAARLAGRRGTD